LPKRIQLGNGARSGESPDRADRQPALTIALHWGTVIAILLSVGAIYLRDAVEDKGMRALLLDLHRQIGMLVLLSVPIRQVVRLIAGHKETSANFSKMLALAARLAHGALYGLLVAIPVIGWAVTSAHAVDLRLFGVIALPGLVTPDSDLADALTDYHAWAAYALIGLIFVHALAALWHHYVLRDSVLASMLPGFHARAMRRQQLESRKPKP
jgi:cytochrome b561